MSSTNPSHRELGTSRWKQQRKRVLERDGYQCTYCGGTATQVDHIVPRVSGGGHELDNLTSCCAKCNQLKGSKSHAVFLGVRSTPPVFSDSISPITHSTIVDSPMSVRPSANQ